MTNTVDGQWHDLVREIGKVRDSKFASEVQTLLADLTKDGVIGVDRYGVKIRRALRQPAELSATVREGVYARYFARQGLRVTIEPSGKKGPDLGVVLGAAYANIEIKRLTVGESTRVLDDEELEGWHQDETDPSAPVARREPATRKVRSVVLDAHAQLVTGQANVVVLHDSSLHVARGNFVRAMRDIQDEITTNGTYGRISAVEYDSNWFQQQNNYFWVNSDADVAVEPMLLKRLVESAEERDKQVVEMMEAFASSVTG